jgi:tRNA-splicing ligase RtcB
MAVPKALGRISETVWELPVSYKKGMRVPARIYGTEKLIQEMDEAVFDQVTNVATLPGITKYSLCAYLIINKLSFDFQGVKPLR